MPGAPLLAFTRASAFLRFLRSTTASMDGPIAVWLSTSVLAARASGSWAAALRASPVCPGAQVQLDLIVLPHGPARSPLYLPLPPFRPSSGCPGYLCPLLTSTLRSERLA